MVYSEAGLQSQCAKHPERKQKVLSPIPGITTYYTQMQRRTPSWLQSSTNFECQYKQNGLSNLSFLIKKILREDDEC